MKSSNAHRPLRGTWTGSTSFVELPDYIEETLVRGGISSLGVLPQVRSIPADRRQLPLAEYHPTTDEPTRYTAGHTKLTNVFRKNENIAFSPSYNAIVAKSNQIFTIFEKDDSDLATTRRDKIMGPPPLPPGPRMPYPTFLRSRRNLFLHRHNPVKECNIVSEAQ